MYPKDFEYHSPEGIEEALNILEKNGSEAKIMGGGQSLIPMMKLRIVAPKHIVDINKISSLDFIKDEGKRIVIGTLTRMADVEKYEALRKKVRIIPECAEQIADPLVRNMGTFGGNIAHGDPNNDMPAAVLVTGARIVCRSKSGAREIEARNFFVDTFTTALKENEILESVVIPVSRGYKGTYIKMERIAGDYGIAGVAVWFSSDGERFRDCRIALTGVGPTVIYAEKACNYLNDQRITREAIKRASEVASQESKPSDDLRGSESFKRKVVSLLVRRAFEVSLKEVGSEP